MIIRGLAWDFAGKVISVLARLVFSVFLTRLLSPEDFGLFGILFVLFSIVQVYQDVGFGSALIQKETINEDLLSSVYWMNVIIGLLLGLLFYSFSGVVGQFYEDTRLIDPSRAVSLIFIIGSLSTVHRLRLRRLMDFKTISIVEFSAMMVSNLVAVWLAYRGYGYWSLVAIELIKITLLTLLFWITSGWRPKLYFSWTDIKSIWGFSSKQFLNKLLTSVFTRLDFLIISKLFPLAVMGFYTRAKSLNQYVIQFSSESLVAVLFPAFSKHQRNIERVINLYRKSLKLVAFLSVLLSGLLFLVADELFFMLFGEEWLVSAQYFKLLAVNGYMYPLSSIMVNLLLGLGFAGKNLRLGIIKKLVYALPVLLAFQYGIEAFLIGLIIHGLISVLLNTKYVASVIPFSFKDQVLWIANILLSGFVLTATLSFIFGIAYDITSLVTKSICFLVLFAGYNYFSDRYLRGEFRSFYNKVFSQRMLRKGGE